MADDAEDTMDIAFRPNADLSDADLLVVPVTDPPVPLSGPAARVDRALEGLVARAVADGELSGEAGSSALFRTSAAGVAPRVLVVGVGKAEGPAPWRSAGETVAAEAGRLKAARILLALPATEGPVEVSAFVDGFGSAAYRFDRFKSAEDAPVDHALTVTGGRATAADLDLAAAAVAAVNRARDLVNTPANHLTPSDLVARARELAEESDDLECTVLTEAELAELGAGAFLSVAAGSEQPGYLIALHYRPPTVARDGEVLGIVGKAITFDAGGISIKPSQGMEEMKMDMGGGAAAIEGIGLIASLGLPIEVLAVVPTTENMPSGEATRPGDVVTAMSGATIEVVNTDAEGRMVLADGMEYALRNGATRLIDLATLTGAIVVALGDVYAGLFGTDQDWLEEVRQAGEISGDLVWPMPLHERYESLLDSKVADVANVSAKRQAGATVAADFLRRFAGEVPWCHVDIAGTGMVDGAGTGFGVRLLLALAQRLSLTR